jgi:CRP-like cAMP-binding protein
MYNSSENIEKLIATLPQEIQESFANVGETVSIRKNEYLLREGERCKHLYLIEKGVFRTYRTIIKNELPVEVTSGFSFPGDFDTSPSSLILKIPSRENIQALIDSVVVRFDFSKLETLQNSNSKFNELIFLALIDYTTAIEDVLFEFRVLSARERYEKLVKEHPDYVQKIPLKYLASFLNMKEETLSRIRKS